MHQGNFLPYKISYFAWKIKKVNTKLNYKKLKDFFLKK